MEIKYKEQIALEKELNSLDKFVIDFTGMLNKLKINYVLVSGYVAILFGRNRTSEDIDLLIEESNFEKFLQLWNELSEKFECLNTNSPEKAYKEFLLEGTAIRFSEKKKYVPNIEVKFAKTELDKWTVENRKKVLLNNKKLFISPIELQITFKLLLGSKKDIEDARYLYRIFKEYLKKDVLLYFKQKLKIEEAFNKYLK